MFLALENTGDIIEIDTAQTCKHPDKPVSAISKPTVGLCPHPYNIMTVPTMIWMHWRLCMSDVIHKYVLN